MSVLINSGRLQTINETSEAQVLPSDFKQTSQPFVWVIELITDMLGYPETYTGPKGLKKKSKSLYILLYLDTAANCQAATM